MKKMPREFLCGITTTSIASSAPKIISTSHLQVQQNRTTPNFMHFYLLRIVIDFIMFGITKRMETKIQNRSDSKFTSTQNETLNFSQYDFASSEYLH